MCTIEEHSSGPIDPVGEIASGAAKSAPKEAAIRSARPEDAEAIAAIFAYYVTETVTTFETTPPDAAHWRERIEAHTRSGMPFLVLARGGAVLGYALASPWRPKPAYRHTLEDSIYLAPDHTGQGYGRRLLVELLARCARFGARQMIAVIADSGDPASQALHRSLGFEESGRLHKVGSKHGKRIDTVLMQRELSP